MSVAQPAPEPHLIVLTPDEAVRRACGLPEDVDTALNDVTDEEWNAFTQALAES